MKENLYLFDTSDYPEDNIFDIPRVNKKIPGYFKDELNSQIITEFAGLRAKMYIIIAEQLISTGENSFKKVRGCEKIKKAKGVKKYVLKNQLTFDDYHDCIFKQSTVSKNQNSIRSKLHHVYSITQKKVMLSGCDNKRYILADNIKTLPWGHHIIDQNI